MLIGVVGKPSAGKSTFFRACTMADVEIANYPFTTIKPNQAVGFVRMACADTFFGKQCNPRFGSCEDHRRFVPVEMIDVAGLVPGAHAGEGMGLQFMSDLNMADALIHIVDVSGSVDAHGKMVQPLGYDPVRDVEFLEKELDYWYAGIVKKGWDRFSRQVQMERREPHKAIARQLSGLRVTENMVKASLKVVGLEGRHLTEWTEQELLQLAHELRKRSKPMIIAANKIDIPGSGKNLERLRERFPEHVIVPCTAEGELALKEAKRKGLIRYIPGEDDFEVVGNDVSDRQKQALKSIRAVMKEFDSTGVQKVLNTAVFDLLKYRAVYPGGVNKLEDSKGNVLPDCFLMPPGATALDFAYRLHTDFGKNFVKAINVKTKLAVGKDYVLRNGDVIEIMART